MSVYVDHLGVLEHVPVELLQSLQFGEGAFETIRVDKLNGIEWCDAHWARWVEGLTYLDVEVDGLVKIQDWIHAIQMLADDQAFTSDWMVARPQGAITETGEFRWWIQWSEGRAWPHPIHIGRVPTVPLPDEYKPAAMKLNMMSYYRHAERQARSKEWDFPILCTKEGLISESSRANLFWMKGDHLFTPSKQCLPLHGVVRSALIDWVHAQNELHIAEVEATMADLLDAEGVFLSNSLQHMVWVDGVEGHTFTKTTQFEELVARFKQDIPYTTLSTS
jgi:4-amino-4-deoxychorismate lyase